MGRKRFKTSSSFTGEKSFFLAEDNKYPGEMKNDSDQFIVHVIAGFVDAGYKDFTMLLSENLFNSLAKIN